MVVALSTLAAATIIDSCRCGRNRRPMTANDGRVWSGFTLKNTIYLYDCTYADLTCTTRGRQDLAPLPKNQTNKKKTPPNYIIPTHTSFFS